MCGIAGYYNFNQKSIGSNIEISKMLSIQRHRGPDDTGVVAFSLSKRNLKEFPVAEEQKIEDFEGVIGFNRLSILDLSFHGHQPMISNDGMVGLCLNGEIYNAFDFKRQLMDDGFKFRSTTDTEIVLYLYLKHGLEGMLSRLNGMFAIAIFDLNIGQLVIARDRFGIKPMYYFYDGGRFAFSSEIKSFYSLDNFKPSLNLKKFDEFLLFRGLYRDTLLDGVKTLQPGTSLRIDRDNVIDIKPFFKHSDYNRSSSNIYDKSKVQASLKESLIKSVKRQLISDVKLGCQLSGGIDSSIVTRFAKDLGGENLLESFSIVFNNKNYSEENYIDYVAKSLSLRSHKYLLTGEYYLDNLYNSTFHLEAPINHPNTIGIYLLAQKAKKDVTVLLSGEGADEIFGGYSRYGLVRYRYQKVFWKELARFPGNSFHFLKSYLNIDTYAVLSSAFTPLNLAHTVKRDFDIKNAIDERLDLYDSFTGSIFDKQVKYELSTYLPDLLVRQDKMSMAHSIENRVPFLDNELLETVFRIPENLLIRNERNHEKFILKEVAADLFGRDFAFRNKVGFGIPLKEFFLDKRFNDFIYDFVLSSLRDHQLFNWVVVEKLYKNVKNLNYKEIELLWLIISFQVWYDMYIKNSNRKLR